MTPPPQNGDRTRRVRFAPGSLLLLVSAAFVGWLVIANAWVSEDAYIAFRSVEQLHAGIGPRWNPHERVQAFTHPLWFLTLAAGGSASLS